MIYDIIEEKLAQIEGIEPGVSLFRNQMPSEIPMAVMVAGPLSGVSVDPYIRGWFKPDVQIVVRHPDPVDGMKLATLISDTLTFEGEVKYPANDERPEVKLSLFYPKTLPIQFPRLEGNEYEFSQHFVTAFGFI